ncbi:hypothetical protein [Flavobacterium ginsengiterrae]|uniref:Uncharacterized protein n=1 Tax=Flavobacterium ginsengiterrae TaxID=871695 RepID=A0ABP7GAJ9_9FLAO
MENEKEFRYVLVGNIIDKHFFGDKKEIKSGTKHFRAGAKVYLFPEYGGIAHEKIPVYGLPKKSFRRITIVISSNLIKNTRVKKTYDPILIDKIDRTFFYSDQGNDGLENLNRFAETFIKNNIELK